MKNNYHEIGMDHFALKTDSMYKSFKKTFTSEFYGLYFIKNTINDRTWRFFN
jgi:hypothetical protein